MKKLNLVFIGALFITTQTLAGNLTVTLPKSSGNGTQTNKITSIKLEPRRSGLNFRHQVKVYTNASYCTLTVWIDHPETSPLKLYQLLTSNPNVNVDCTDDRSTDIKSINDTARIEASTIDWVLKTDTSK